MAKKIIGLVGLQASGKGTAAKYLSDKYGASTHRFSTMLRDVMNRMCIDISRDNMQTLSSILRQNFGEDLMARVIAKDAENDQNEIVIVDGVRRFTDLFYLEKVPNFQLVSIETEQGNRYRRLVARGENTGDKDKSIDDFIADEKREADREIPDVMKTASVVINNDQDFDALYKQLDALLK